MRRLVLLAMFAFSFPGISVASPVDCAPLGAPAELTLAIKDFGAIDHYVELKWTPPPFDSNAWDFAGWDVERREGEDPFASVGGPLLLTATEPSNGFALNYIRDADACDAGACAAPGGTYTYRVAARFKYQPGCNQFDGVTYRTAFTAEATITVPGGSPDGEVPRNLSAVSHPKKQQVVVTWQAPASGTIDGYVVERRTTSASPGAKAESAFLEVARITKLADGMKFLDRSVEPDSEYEYRIATFIDLEILRRTTPDKAYTAGRCPPSYFAVWYRDWLSSTLSHVSFGNLAAAAPLRVTVGPTDAEPDAVAIGPGRFNGMDKITLRGQLDHPFGVFAALPAGTQGKFRAKMRHDDPFDPASWNQADCELTFGKEKLLLDIERSLANPLFTKVCGTIGAGKRKGETARVGEPVAFVFQVAALGPSPLLAGQLQIQADVEGGTLVGTLPGPFVRVVADGAGATRAECLLGALGPVRSDRSQVAIVTFVAAAGTLPADRQLRVRVKFVPLPESGLQSITFAQPERVAEVRIVPLVPTKD